MKNKILKAISIIDAFVFAISASTLDSDSCIPAIVAAISLAWLFLFYLANRKKVEWFED